MAAAVTGSILGPNSIIAKEIKNRQTLWKKLRSYGIPEKLITMIANFYENFQACVSVGNNKVSDFFNISTGVDRVAFYHLFFYSCH